MTVSGKRRDRNCHQMPDAMFKTDLTKANIVLSCLDEETATISLLAYACRNDFD